MTLMTCLKRHATLLTLSILSQGGLGADINFITPSDLPKTAPRSYVERGRGFLPDFPEGYGIKEALSSTAGEKECMAKLGQQVSPWKTQKIQIANYWTYIISADFECLAPTTSDRIIGDSAKQLFADLAGLSIISVDGSNRKEASVLCYWNTNNTVTHEYHICELGDFHAGGKMVKLEDIVQLGPTSETVIQDQGARRLTSDLPVYIDYRREAAEKQLKGIERQAAVIACSQSAERGTTFCQIDGMIVASPAEVPAKTLWTEGG